MFFIILYKYVLCVDNLTVEIVIVHSYVSLPEAILFDSFTEENVAIQNGES